MTGSDRSKSDAGAPFTWPELDNFSLVLGGPHYQLLRKAHLGARVEDHLLWRIAVISGIIWARFLWQVSRIDLDLIPTHPDRSAGLGFLGGSAFALSPLLSAHGVVI